MKQFDPSRSDFSPYGLTVEQWLPSVMTRPDRHNEIEINLLRKGKLVYLFRGERVTLTPGQICLFWATIPHQIIEADENEPYYVITIPLAMFLQWRIWRPVVDCILQGQIVSGGHSRTESRDIELVERWHQDLTFQDPNWNQVVQLEIQARLSRLALEIAAISSTPGTNSPLLNEPATLKSEDMASFIAKHYTSSLTVADIAAAVELHPNYAMSLYKETFSTTMIETILQYRLSHAQRLLVTTHQNILSVALEAGFGSLSRFNEAFRRKFNCSPREYRKYHRL